MKVKANFSLLSLLPRETRSSCGWNGTRFVLFWSFVFHVMFLHFLPLFWRATDRLPLIGCTCASLTRLPCGSAHGAAHTEALRYVSGWLRLGEFFFFSLSIFWKVNNSYRFAIKQEVSGFTRQKGTFNRRLWRCQPNCLVVAANLLSNGSWTYAVGFLSEYLVRYGHISLFRVRLNLHFISGTMWPLLPTGCWPVTCTTHNCSVTDGIRLITVERASVLKVAKPCSFSQNRTLTLCLISIFFLANKTAALDSNESLLIAATSQALELEPAGFFFHICSVMALCAFIMSFVFQF